jgi:hypothetical protein
MNAAGAPQGGRALAPLALAAAVAVTFADALFGPGVFFQRDILSYWYPGMAAFRRAVAEGAWPLWNPHVGFGAPLLADASFQLAYPPTWLALVLPLHVYYKLFAAGHCLWAASGTYLLARRLGVGRLGAAVAGGAFSLSGPFLSAASLFHHYAGASWIPWVLAALESLLRRPGLVGVAGLALASGGQLLAGSGDMCLGTAAIGSARVAWHVARSRPAGARARRLATGILLSASLAAALGAVQWLPTAEQTARGSRPGQGAASAYWSLHPLSLGDLLVPRLVAGAPLAPGAREVLFEGRAPLLDCVYLGTVVLALGGLALSAGARTAWLSAAGALFFLVAALGRHTALSAALAIVPGFALMRYPQKHLLPLALCAALAAGVGASAWAGPWPASWRRRGRVTAWVAIGLGAVLALGAAWLAGAPARLGALLEEPAALGPAALTASLRVGRTALLLGCFGLLLAWRAGRERAPSLATLLLVALAAIDLVAVGRAVNPLAPAELVSHRPALVDLLSPHAERTRVLALTAPGCGRVTGGKEGWDPSWSAALSSVDALRPPSGVRWGLFGSFDGQFTGLEPSPLLPFLPAAVRLSGTPDGLRLLQAANVGHVVRLGTGAVPGLELLETRATAHTCPLQVLRVPDPLPRAYVVGEERRLPGTGDGLAALLDPAFDPRRSVLLADARPGGGAAGPVGEARVTSRRADTVEVEAELAQPGVLVLAESHDPGWRVSVDGRPASLLRANVLFRGVRLPAGRHRVLFSYRPWAAGLGLGLSVAGVIGTVALGLLGWRRRARLKPAPGPGSIAAREEGP